MNRTRRWVAIDQPSMIARIQDTLVCAELTPQDIGFLAEDIGFLAEAINAQIEQWGDPEGDLEALRRKLRGEPAP